ncbi:conjugative transfer protein [Orientia tsutsugamushi]|nr:TraE/TraK family type IV conjugative transfer system protein [Orientia tsutsugamushi]KJV72467.1 traE family protein [Orientia tsutsugamushi str. TA763]KJV73546.1 traE family protein [Orientia tsutsugamushi str. TA763]KJV73998.1 traE family protein [Orientia tsutsugamushi str. TA763]SPP23696.1 conjugative transfer protein [Orientia tsutsugamushi]SPP24239.1 conjugative transfer protein [Orientia tsutsugamushi]
MNHLFKQNAIQELVKYNKCLLSVTILLAAANIIAIMAAITKEEKWLLIPAMEPDRKMTVSSKNYHETYLKEWAIYVTKLLFTTSPNEVERQIANMKVASSNTESLNKFFHDHLQFVKGSNVSSVFFPKKIEVIKDGVLISGTLRYWFSDSKDIAVDKTYLLTYKQTPNYLLLLTGVKENGIKK